MTKNKNTGNTSKSKPTQAELEVLQVLWKHGASTVKFVNELLSQQKEVGYTTTLKIMQNMLEKGLLERTEEGRKHIYATKVTEADTQKKLLNRFMETAFGGSAMKLVMQALGNHKASKEEIAEIRDLLDKIEKGGQK